jgi:hypothetical protein
LSFCKPKGYYKTRDFCARHCGFPGLGDTVLQLECGGWDVVAEGFGEFQSERLFELLEGVAETDVKKVLIVLGINSFRGCLQDNTRQQSEARESELVTQTAQAVFGVMLELATWFPRADILYLGAGRVYSTPCGKLPNINQGVLAQINRMSQSVLVHVQAKCVGWGMNKEGWRHSYPGLKIFQGFLQTIPGVWEGWNNDCVADEWGHLSKRGTIQFCNNLVARLSEEYLGDFRNRTISSVRKGLEMRDVIEEVRMFLLDSAHNDPELFPELVQKEVMDTTSPGASRSEEEQLHESFELITLD